MLRTSLTSPLLAAILVSSIMATIMPKAVVDGQQQQQQEPQSNSNNDDAVHIVSQSLVEIFPDLKGSARLPICVIGSIHS